MVNAIVPTLDLGPSFIGSSFGLNVFSLGLETYVSDLLGRDAFVAAGSVGRNLEKDTPLNNTVELFYQRKLVPVTSSYYTHSPTLYAGASRRVIHNHIDRFDGVADSVYFADMPQYDLENVLHDLSQNITVGDRYRHEFRLFNLGVQIPLRPRHSLAVEAGHRRYYETLNRQQYIHDSSRFYQNGVDVTTEIEGAGDTSFDEIHYFTGLEYFRSSEFTLAYNYYDIEPEADTDIAPKGTALFARFRYMRSTYADSLVRQVMLHVPVGMYSDGSFALGQYVPDPIKDELRPFNRDRDIHEYLFFAQRFQGLPWFRHTLDGTIFTAYRDVKLKDSWKGEGSGYNWPLKYYLGGAYLLSGYPYFSFWGTKLFYTRFDYVFPIRRNIAKNVMGQYFQRLYGSVFFEAAKVWNFGSLSMDKLREGEFKRDVGVELRLKMVSFYRLPMFLTARVAWPLDDMGDSPYRDEREARRYYFFLQM